MRTFRNPVRSNYWSHWASRACTVILTMSLVANAEQTAGEYQVEAAYLYDFAKMMHWPVRSLPNSSTLIVGVFGGDDDFVTVLRDISAGKIINGHALEIRRLRSPEELKFCHLIFFRTLESNTRETIEQLGKTSILLVGQDKNFLSDGGMINMVLSNGKVTYELNAAALEHAHIHYAGTRSTSAKTRREPAAVDPKNSRSIVFRMVPEYPRIAAALKITGAVQLQVTVRADGTVKQVWVLGGHPTLAEAASQAVMRWRYEPASKETTESVRVSFAQ
jgi:TonB family protein